MGNNMNEKILELAEQADEYAWKQFPDTTTYPHPADWQVIRDGKFAELIAKLYIKDCRDMFMVNSTSWNLLNEKLRCFGVE
jgi:hypothetical protein